MNHQKHYVILILLNILIGLIIVPSIQSTNPYEEENGKAEPEYHSFLYDDITRYYYIYIPDSISPDAPLIFVLHGYSGSAWDMISYTDMEVIADEQGFAVCYPQGTEDDFGITHWNARLTISQTDDIGFLSALAVYLQTTYDLSSEKTFSCGHSNGGYMSYTLACEASDVFKAIANVAGTMSGYSWDNRDIAEPTPILHIHGTDDDVVPIDGSMSWPGGWGGAPHVDTIIEFWAELNNCTIQETSFYPANTNAYYYRNGVNGNEVWYYKINNWGHGWPQPYDNTGTNATEVIWEFFYNYIMYNHSNQSLFDRGFPIRHAADGDWAAAQSIKPSFIQLTKAEIYLRKFGNPEFNLTVELRTDHPEGNLIDTLIFNPGEVPTNWEWFALDFTDTPITPETEYFIVCPPAPSGVTTSFGYEWGYAFGNHYYDGSFWFTRDGGDLWRELSDSYEFTFRTYGNF